MSDLIKKFSLLLKDIKYPNKEEGWDIEGVLYQQTNKPYKFDLSPMQKFKDNSVGKIGKFDSKAEKIVFNFTDKWVILDTDEIHQYIKKCKTKSFILEDLISKTDWNIIISKT
jgi:hypothetical protein